MDQLARALEKATGPVITPSSTAEGAPTKPVDPKKLAEAFRYEAKSQRVHWKDHFDAARRRGKKGKKGKKGGTTGTRGSDE